MRADTATSPAPRGPSWPARFRRRRLAVAVTVGVALLTAIAATRLVEPSYRAVARLALDGKTLSVDQDVANASAHVATELQARHERVLVAARQASAISPRQSERVQTRVTDVAVDPVSERGVPLLSASFEVSIDAADAREASQATTLLLDLYLEDDERAHSAPPVPPAELVAVRAEASRLASLLAGSQAELADLEREHGPLGSMDDPGGQLTALANQARTLAAQIDDLQARRVELDRGLRDMQRGASEYRSNPGMPLTSEALSALQAQWTVLRTRNGSDAATVRELGAMIEGLQATADAKFGAAAAELATAVAEYARLEQVYPLDHPDVVRQAHTVSALESRLESLRVRGLTSGDRAYVEGLARERSQIDGRLEVLRERRESLSLQIAEQQAQATRAPEIRQRRAELQREYAELLAAQQTALEQQQLLEARFDAVLEQRPGRIATPSPLEVHRVLMSRPDVILALGLIAGVVAAFLTVAVRERVDARISGTESIRRMQGHLPLAEIPRIRTA